MGSNVPVKKRAQVLEAHAECFTCGWQSDARNAQATAATHARRHGHEVHATVTMSTVYRPWARAEVEEQVAIRATLAGDDPDEAVAAFRQSERSS